MSVELLSAIGELSSAAILLVGIVVMIKAGQREAARQRDHDARQIEQLHLRWQAQHDVELTELRTLAAGVKGVAEVVHNHDRRVAEDHGDMRAEVARLTERLKAG